MLHVVTWLWGDKFSPDDVAKLQRGVRRNLSQPYRMICITAHCEGAPQTLQHETDGPITLYELPRDAAYLIHTKGCFVRLKMFDPDWQRSVGVNKGDRLVCIDLDTVITGPLDPLFDRPEPFVIMQHGNASNPCPMNGALMMISAGAHPEVWDDFSLDAADKVPFFEFPDDQGWIWAKLPDAAGWKCGAESQVYVFRKPGWPSFDRKMKRGGDDLPKGARLVTFSGGRSPETFKHLDWVKDNWRV